MKNNPKNLAIVSLLALCASGGGLLATVAGLPAAAGAPPAGTASSTSYNGLALTPPMGFDDWNAYGCNINSQ
jgi:alpha-galactosidase